MNAAEQTTSTPEGPEDQTSSTPGTVETPEHRAPEQAEQAPMLATLGFALAYLENPDAGLAAVADGRLDPARLVTRTRDLSEGPAALRELGAPALTPGVTVLTP